MTRSRIVYDRSHRIPETAARYSGVRLKYTGTPMLHIDFKESDEINITITLSLPDANGGGSDEFVFMERISLIAIFRCCDLDLLSFLEGHATSDGKPESVFLAALESSVRQLGSLHFRAGSKGGVIVELELCNRRSELGIKKSTASLLFDKT